VSATTTSPSDPAMARYLTLMREVKLRGEVIEGILTGQLTLIYDQPTVEALFLQLRLVLESIALGWLVAHQEDFDNMQAKMRAYHKPIGLLNALEKHHPKSTDLNIGAARLAVIEDRINNMHSKLHNWNSAQTAYDALCRDHH